MKVRLVKKFAAIAKRQPGRLTHTHIQYLMKSWRASYRRLTEAQKYALSKTFIAFEYYNEFQRLIALRAKKPAPKYAPGTHQITDWEPGVPIQRGEFVLMPDGSVYEPLATSLSPGCSNNIPKLPPTECRDFPHLLSGVRFPSFPDAVINLPD